MEGHNLWGLGGVVCHPVNTESDMSGDGCTDEDDGCTDGYDGCTDGYDGFSDGYDGCSDGSRMGAQPAHLRASAG